MSCVFFGVFQLHQLQNPHFHWPKPPWPRILGDRFKTLVKPAAMSSRKELLKKLEKFDEKKLWWYFGFEDVFAAFSSVPPQNKTRNILQNTHKLVGSKKSLENLPVLPISTTLTVSRAPFRLSLPDGMLLLGARPV